MTIVPMADDSAALIISIATNADRAAFAALFNRFAPRLKAYALRLGASHALAEDIAQESMLTLWRKAGSFDPGRATAEAWIFAIARNLRIDLFRRARFEVIRSELPEKPSEELNAEAVVAAVQYAARVRRALGALPTEQAEVIRLSFFDDRPHAEIERTLGVPLGTVKSRLRLAMARLRPLLDDLR